MSRYPLEIEDDDVTTNVEQTPVEITPEVERLARRPYSVVIERDEDGDYMAHVPELPGLIAVAPTLDALYALVEDAKRAWIADALHHGERVPEPQKVSV